MTGRAVLRAVQLGAGVALALGGLACSSGSTQPPAGTDTSFPNEPAGFTTFNADYLFPDSIPVNNSTVKLSDGWSSTYTSQGLLTQVVDGTVPTGAPHVGQWSYPVGFNSGSAPGTLGYGFGGGPTEVYVSFWVKFSNPWQPANTSGVSKMAFLQTNTGDQMYIQFYGTNTSTWTFNFESEYSADARNAAPNVGTTLHPSLGVWHHIEWYVKLASAAGAKDGIIRWYIDGVQQGNITNYNGTTPLADAELSPTFGGTGSPKSEQDYVWFSNVHLSHP